AHRGRHQARRAADAHHDDGRRRCAMKGSKADQARSEGAQRPSRGSGAGIEGVPASDRVGGLGAKPPDLARSEGAQRPSRGSGAGIEGVPASDRVGGLGAKPPDLEVERYELSEPLRYRFELERRDFVKLFGGGLLVLVAAPAATAQESGRGSGG